MLIKSSVKVAKEQSKGFFGEDKRAFLNSFSNFFNFAIVIEPFPELEH